MANWMGGSCPAMANQIAGGFMLLSPNNLKGFQPGELQALKFELERIQRNTRAELTAWIDKYFRAFPMGVCNAVSSCRRLENGAGNFNCAGGGAGGSCSSGPLPNPPAMVPRVLIGDPETGIAVGMTMFMGNTDMHMIKMYGGQVYAVHAVLGGATSSGW